MEFLNEFVEDAEWNAPRGGPAQLGPRNDEDRHHHPESRPGN